MLLELCNSKTSFFLKIDNKKPLELEKAAAFFQEKHKLLAKTPYLIVCLFEDVRLTVYKYKIRIHTTDRDKAMKIAESIDKIHREGIF